MSALTKHIGQRIRLYRKAKNITLQELAGRIHKSKSAVSKYEHGEIAIDVEVLAEIARELGVSVSQLLDYEEPRARSAVGPSEFFAQSSRLYMYCLNMNSSRVVSSVLELNHGPAPSVSSVLYWNLESFDNLYRCGHLYFGDIQYSDSYVNLIMQNQNNSAERVFLNIANPLSQSTTTVGIISGISDKYMLPISLKFILSVQRKELTPELLRSLQLTKEDIQAMKRAHGFSVMRL